MSVEMYQLGILLPTDWTAEQLKELEEKLYQVYLWYQDALTDVQKKEVMEYVRATMPNIEQQPSQPEPYVRNDTSGTVDYTGLVN